MQTYKLSGKKKGPKKIFIILGIILAALILFISIVGVIADSQSAEKENISAAVEENVQLKQQIDELNATIADLRSQIDGLNSDLSARPTLEPTPYAPAGDEAARATESPMPQ